MRNMREIVGNLCVMGGMLTSGVALTDALHFAVANGSRGHMVFEITDDLQEEYGMGKKNCSKETIYDPKEHCAEYVIGRESSEEKEKIFAEYQRELKEKSDALPVHPYPNNRKAIDSLSVIGGTGMMLAGLFEKITEQEKKKI